MSAGLSHRGAVALLCFCALCWSIAGVFTRLLERAEGFEVTFWRSLFCVIGVTAALAWQQRGRFLRPVIAMGRAGVVSGVMWAVMFTCFMLALTRTSVANTLLVSSLSPLMAALLARLVLGVRVRAGTWVAISDWAALIVPVSTPCTARIASSVQTSRTRPMAPRNNAAPRVARMSINRRP